MEDVVIIDTSTQEGLEMNLLCLIKQFEAKNDVKKLTKAKDLGGLI